ncbi:MAG: hypothetical protein A2Y93_17065 [Chloroflexi bacterium RBG_13_68_17]|nr:MAG: hypothetical protein A2Y93_17065 [Chloroflexi bacterium RBG_13_68_17]
MRLPSVLDNASPYEEIESARRTRLVLGVCNVSIVFSIPLIIVVSVMLLPRINPAFAVAYGLCVGILPMSVIARQVALRRGPEQAAYLYIFYTMTVLAYSTTIIQGILDLAVPGYIILILVAGMTLKTAGTYFTTALAGVAYFTGQLLLRGTDVASPFPAPLAALTLSVLILLSFGFVTLIDQITTTDLRRALSQATYDLVQTNRKLKEASERKSQFTARASHELRTPLSSMIVFTDLALREAYGPINVRLRKALTHVLTSARQLKAIINDILDLSKIEAGQIEIANDTFALARLVEAVQSAAGGIAQEKGLRFVVSVSPDLPAWIIGDEGRLSQILVNLASNGVKFTEKGHVEVRLEPAPANRWRMFVLDTGPGIPEDKFERIFQAYRQLDNTASTSGVKGTGLGLAITRHLVRLMGGDVSLASELGRGSLFTVELPLRPGQPAAPQVDQVIAA